MFQSRLSRSGPFTRLRHFYRFTKSSTSPSTLRKSSSRHYRSQETINDNEKSLGPFSQEDQRENVRKVGLEIAEKLGITAESFSRWYSLTPTEVLRYGGLKLHWRHRYSIPYITKATYPDHAWDEAKFLSPPSADLPLFDTANARAALLYIGDRLGIDGNNLENWYKVSSKDMKDTGLLGTLPARLNSRLRLLQVAFPEHEWLPEKFVRKGTNYWKSSENARKVVEILGDKLGIKKGDYEAWYKINATQIPPGILRSQSRFRFFSSVFPEHKWSRHSFVSTGVNVFSASEESLSHLAKELEKLLGIEAPVGWYSVTRKDLVRLGFIQRDFPTQGHLLCMLQTVYPSIDWDPGRLNFAANGFGSLLANIVKFFGRDTATRGEGQTLLVSKFKLLFDYQGPQVFAKKILEKREMIEREDKPSLLQWCEENGFTLISIPFWFDRHKSAFLAELFGVRPDLFAESGPLFPHRDIASITPMEPRAVPRRSLTINKTYLKMWKSDPRFEGIKAIEKPSTPKRRGLKGVETLKTENLRL